MAATRIGLKPRDRTDFSRRGIGVAGSVQRNQFDRATAGPSCDWWQARLHRTRRGPPVGSDRSRARRARLLPCFGSPASSCILYRLTRCRHCFPISNASFSESRGQRTLRRRGAHAVRRLLDLPHKAAFLAIWCAELDEAFQHACGLCKRRCASGRSARGLAARETLQTHQLKGQIGAGIRLAAHGIQQGQKQVILESGFPLVWVTSC